VTASERPRPKIEPNRTLTPALPLPEEIRLVSCDFFAPRDVVLPGQAMVGHVKESFHPLGATSTGNVCENDLHCHQVAWVGATDHECREDRDASKRSMTSEVVVPKDRIEKVVD
jgi:hypothetical protein